METDREVDREVDHDPGLARDESNDDDNHEEELRPRLLPHTQLALQRDDQEVVRDRGNGDDMPNGKRKITFTEDLQG